MENDETFTPMSCHEHVLARMCSRADGDRSTVGSQIHSQNVALKLEEKKVHSVYSGDLNTDHLKTGNI